MELKTLPSKCRAFVNTSVVLADFSAGCYSGTLSLDVNGIHYTDQLDYRSDIDAYYHMSDDGNEFYHSVYIFNDDEDEEVPDIGDIKKVTGPISEMVMKLSDGQILAEDMTYFINICNTPALLCSQWKKNGKDIEKAQRAIMRDIFGV